MRLPFKKIFFTIGLLVLCFSKLTFGQANDTITICHKYFTTTFSMSRRFPVVVKYWLTKEMFNCEQKVKRSNRFKLDPLIPDFTNLDNDYRHSGYDRGHQMDAYDCGCDSTAMSESFYYRVFYLLVHNRQSLRVPLAMTA
jgi:DNA/RNA endonuclease G (NUC1)